MIFLRENGRAVKFPMTDGRYITQPSSRRLLLKCGGMSTLEDLF